MSKFILGGKGTGKTHLLRYFSYPVSRLRYPELNGVEVVEKQGSLAVFLRAAGTDAARFEGARGATLAWQHLFGVYLELRLAESVLDALIDIERSSPDVLFHLGGFLTELGRSIQLESEISSLQDFRSWLIGQRRAIDFAVNNAAFTGNVDVQVPFSLSALSLSIGSAVSAWCSRLVDVPLIYLIDEIENFSPAQQQVVNSLIRYGSGAATFRISGRLYAMQTQATLGGGEENREGSEFRVTNLDAVLRQSSRFFEFAREFVAKRLAASVESGENAALPRAKIDPGKFFADIDDRGFFESLIANIWSGEQIPHARRFAAELREILDDADVRLVVHRLCAGAPPLLASLNLLLFCKKWKRDVEPHVLAAQLSEAAHDFAVSRANAPDYYRTAYGHYARDLLAQFFDLSDARSHVPYAGFKAFVQMSCSNPRSLLVVLGRAYSIAAFRGLPFSSEAPLPIELQTEAAIEAAQFMYEADTNYGSKSDGARLATARLAELLATARYATNIPEVSPLSVSLSEDLLTESARHTLRAALNYSFLFADAAGRPDRNSKRIKTKLSLNPLLSPKWGLPVKKGGDLPLDENVANAIFDPGQSHTFDYVLKQLSQKWNRPFRRTSKQETSQAELLL